MLTYIMAGNPGVGKSTLLNSLIGEAKFKSGWSPGAGLTYQLDTIEANGNRYHDTPGLSDQKRREDAAKAIEQALKSGGRYKVLFAVFTQSGRVSPDDATTIKIILKACPIIGNNYGIIINKVAPHVVEKFRANMSKVLAALFTGDFPDTIHVHVNPSDVELEDEDNVYKPLPDDFKSFLERVPEVVIKPADVSKLDVATFEQMKQQYEGQVAELLNDNKKMQDKIERQDKEFRARIDEMASQHDKSIRRQEQALNDLRARQQKEREDHERALSDVQRAQAFAAEDLKLKMHKQEAEHARKLHEIVNAHEKSDAERSAAISKLQKEQAQQQADAAKKQHDLMEKQRNQLAAAQKQNSDLKRRQDELEQALMSTKKSKKMFDMGPMSGNVEAQKKITGLMALHPNKNFTRQWNSIGGSSFAEYHDK